MGRTGRWVESFVCTALQGRYESHLPDLAGLYQCCAEQQALPVASSAVLLHMMRAPANVLEPANAM